MRKVNLRNVDPAIDDPDASTWCKYPIPFFPTVTLTTTSPPNPQSPLAARGRGKFQTPCPTASSKTKETRQPGASLNTSSPFRDRNGYCPSHSTLKRRPFFTPQTLRRLGRSCPWFLSAWLFYTPQSGWPRCVGHKLSSVRTSPTNSPIRSSAHIPQHHLQSLTYPSSYYSDRRLSGHGWFSFYCILLPFQQRRFALAVSLSGAN